MSCPGPQRYDDLPHVPSYGEVMVRGERGEWFLEVSIDQGRDMEDDGIPVYWIFASAPKVVVDLGLLGPWFFLYRVFTWPARFFR